MSIRFLQAGCTCWNDFNEILDLRWSNQVNLSLVLELNIVGRGHSRMLRPWGVSQRRSAASACALQSSRLPIFVKADHTRLNKWAESNLLSNAIQVQQNRMRRWQLNYVVVIHDAIRIWHPEQRQRIDAEQLTTITFKPFPIVSGPREMSTRHGHCFGSVKAADRIDGRRPSMWKAAVVKGSMFWVESWSWLAKTQTVLVDIADAGGCRSSVHLKLMRAA